MGLALRARHTSTRCGVSRTESARTCAWRSALRRRPRRFRGSLSDAVRTRSVAETVERQAPVTTFDDVAVAALLSDRIDDLRRWVGRVLCGLNSDAPGADQRRKTVQVFLASGGSYTQAAARLHLHKNTVHYRVRKAEELRGRPLSVDLLQVEVALLAASLLRHRP